MKSSNFFFSVIQKFLFVGFLSLFLFLPNQALTQLNVDSISHINYQQLHSANLNDVWGYVDELGNEYALVGTSKGTSIVNVTDPTSPVEVFWLPGSTSIWRDPSSHGIIRSPILARCNHARNSCNLGGLIGRTWCWQILVWPIPIFAAW